MDTRLIGSLKVSVVGLGCNNFGRRLNESGTQQVVHAALDAGITFFDTADTYGETDSEVFLGRALGNRRNQIVLASKFGWEIDESHRGAHPDYVRRAIEDSLRRLGTDHIDFYQLHKPDPAVPIEDTLGALDDLVSAGKVREIGCSNFSAEQLRSANSAAGDRARFVGVQNEYSLLHREPEHGVLEECARLDMAFVPFFPLASGLLTGKYRQNQSPPDGSRLTRARFANKLSGAPLDLIESLIAFSEKRGHNLLELAFGWLLAKTSVSSVISGAMSPEQVVSNAGASGWKISQSELAEVDRLLSTSGDLQ